MQYESQSWLYALAESADWWIVFFAPSSSDFALPILQEYFDFRTEGLSPADGKHGARVAAIGPTTADHLRSKSFQVDVVAKKPFAASLLEELSKYGADRNTPVMQ